MRNGRPCLVSTIDSGREVVNPPEAGLAVDPNDPAAFFLSPFEMAPEREHKLASASVTLRRTVIAGD